MNFKNKINVKEGDVVLCDFGRIESHIQGGIRYGLVVSNNIGNIFSPNVQVIPFTSQQHKARIPTHITFEKGEIQGLPERSVLMCETSKPIAKEKIIKVVGHLDNNMFDRAAMGMLLASPAIARAFAIGVQDTSIFKKIQSAM
jgi:mRNA interferase MazF